MHRALTSRVLRLGETLASTSALLYLRPAIRLPSVARAAPRICGRCGNHTEAVAGDAQHETRPEASSAPLRRLPLMCSGCGAFSQTDDPHQIGYYDVKSKRARAWLHPKRDTPKPVRDNKEDEIVSEALQALDKDRLEELGLDPSSFMHAEDATGIANDGPEKPPVCDRCHNLMHYSTTSDTAKVAMFHPTVHSLRETIEESPHKYNHIYHIIDAADFPMSLIPRLNVLIGDIALRTQNRRSRAIKYYRDRQTEMSFIITRGDLLGPTKEMVDAMMPYLREVLRDALGRVGGRVRLGNVRCVSARRSWWTKELREDIWKRGGAGWMVGKVNVGKSQLFEAVYPKGRMTTPGVSTNPKQLRAAAAAAEQQQQDEEEEGASGVVDFGELLPPAQPAKNYPEMPLVSSLPGTTASPIRIPFGNGKGELIDLPGLARSDLELFVKEEHRQSLIMKKRIVPEQVSVKSGRSLILGGGLIRITPRTPDMVFLMYNFTPLEEHLTQTEKAIGFQNQTRESPDIDNITLAGKGDAMAHAGTFKLRYDVTKKRAGPLTRKNAIGLAVERLPFRVLSVDILIEGVGYVEVVAQVRARELEGRSTPARSTSARPRRVPSSSPGDAFAEKFNLRRDDMGVRVVEEEEPEPEPEPNWPAVDVYTPEGRFVDERQPINGWLNNKPRVLKEHKRSRPRRSMKGQKKKEKQLRRQNA